jgi:hypothetical protein
LSNQRNLRRPLTQTLERDHRYVDLLSAARSRSQGAQRGDSKPAATSRTRQSEEHLRWPPRVPETEQPSFLGSSFPGVLIQDPLLDAGRHRTASTSQDTSSEQLSGIAKLQRKKTEGYFETPKNPSEVLKPREQ